MLCVLFALALLSGIGGGSPATAALEDFEAFAIADGTAVLLDVSTLNEHTIANGQGPGLVQAGCTYSGNGLQWNGKGYYGQVSRNIQADVGPLLLSYDYPVNGFNLALSAFDGYPDTVQVSVFNSNYQLIATLGPISVAGATPVPIGFRAPDIRFVEVLGSAHSWSPMIDDHQFGDVGGMHLSTTGVPGGVMDFEVRGAFPNGLVALCHAFGTGSHSGVNPFTGNTLTTGLSSTRFTVAHLGSTNASGMMSYSTLVPPAAAGLVAVQAVDLYGDAVSNVISL